MSVIDIGFDDDHNIAIYPVKHGIIEFNIKKGKKRLATELDIRQIKLVITTLESIVKEYEKEGLLQYGTLI